MRIDPNILVLAATTLPFHPLTRTLALPLGTLPSPSPPACRTWIHQHNRVAIQRKTGTFRSHMVVGKVEADELICRMCTQGDTPACARGFADVLRYPNCRNDQHIHSKQSKIKRLNVVACALNPLCDKACFGTAV